MLLTYLLLSSFGRPLRRLVEVLLAPLLVEVMPEPLLTCRYWSANLLRHAALAASTGAGGMAWLFLLQALTEKRLAQGFDVLGAGFLL